MSWRGGMWPIRHKYGFRQQQAGYLWLLLSVLLAAESALLLIGTSPGHLFKQQQHNARVLAAAHQSLLSYASEPIGLTSCEQNCPRPGDLPCPDSNNDGIAENSCNTDTALLGRLPWKTLGLGELRDASGERLWYAVSKSYKNNTRIRPLNLDTPGGISLRGNSGALLYDAAIASGVVAVLIAPMQPLLRADGVQQQRMGTALTQPVHYLDIAQAEDNATLQDGTQNGVIQQAASEHFNDVLLPLTASVMHRSMQQRVLGELKSWFQCVAPCAALPAPAAITDSGCLGSATIQTGKCLSSSEVSGRLPLDAQGLWPSGNTSHPLSGLGSHHWFQQNGWREIVFYQPGNGNVMLLVAGEQRNGQMRSNDAAKSLWQNYLENAGMAWFGLALSDSSIADSNDSRIIVQRP